MQRPFEKIRARIIVVSIIILLVSLSFVGCVQNGENGDNDKPKGFDQGSLANSVPVAFELTSPTVELKPTVNTTQPRRVSNIIAIWFFEKNEIYRDYGGLININIKNNSTNHIYIYKIGIRPDWYGRRFGQTSGAFADAGKYISPGSEQDVGMIQFYGPTATGIYNYNIAFSIYLENETGSWNDCGSQETSEKTMDVVDPPVTVDYKEHYNLKQYYNKINDIVDPSNSEVFNLSHEVAGDYQGAYNIYQICSLFDYTRENIKYFSDPSSMDNYWCTPEQTIKFGGDCEDHATLLASMIISLGGAVRMYMTDSHAFLGLYIGGESNVEDITKAVQSYYRTDVNLFYLQDKFGCWLMVDTIGSLYLGGLPLGAVPARDGVGNAGWSWGFTETENFYITDVLPK